jgi:chromosome segregation ATPase
MKANKNWRELAEYASLGFSALGTIAAAATQQTLYAATPLTITLSLNLLNRQELARRTRQIGNNITHLEQQFSSNICSLSTQIKSVENSLNALPHSLEATGISKLEEIRQKSQQEIVQLRKQLNALEISFRNIPAPSEPIDLDSVETAIAHLKEQFNDLTDRFNNRQEPKAIEEIKNKFNWLVTYKEFKAQLDKFVTAETVTEIHAQLTEQLNALKLRLDNFPAPPEPIDLNGIEQAIAAIESQLKQLEDLDVSMAALHDNTNSIERELKTQKTQLDNQTQQLLIVPQQLEVLEAVTTQLQKRTRILETRSNGFENELNWLSKLINYFVKAEDLEQELTRLSKQLKDRIDVKIEKQLANQFVKAEDLEQELTRLSKQLKYQIQTFNQLIKETRPAYKYELVFDRDGSREVLLEALKTAKERLILVCPWITYRGADGEVMQLCRKFLDKRGILEIGWGHLSDTSLEKHEPMTEEDFFREVAAQKRSFFSHLTID